MPGRLIGLIYFYLLSAVGILLMVIGVFNIVNYGINITQYDKYPVRYMSYECENLTNPYMQGSVPPQPTIDPKVQQQQKEACEARVDLQRKQTKIEDLKNAITFPLVGIILFLIHFPQARRLSSEKSK